jgi:hypothetical protein
MFLNGFTHPPIDRTRLGRADDYQKLLSFAMGDGAAEDWLRECPLSTVVSGGRRITSPRIRFSVASTS